MVFVVLLSFVFLSLFNFLIITHAFQPNHRLNGSSSPVLTATSLSYGKAKNSTPTKSKPLI